MFQVGKCGLVVSVSGIVSYQPNNNVRPFSSFYLVYFDFLLRHPGTHQLLLLPTQSRQHDRPPLSKDAQENSEISIMGRYEEKQTIRKETT